MSELPPPQTLVGLLRQTVAVHGARPALRQHRNGRWSTLTYEELARQAECFAAALLSFGIECGEHVALLGGGQPEWVVADLGTWLVQGVDVPVPAGFSTSQAFFILSHCGAKVLVVSDAEQLAKAAQMADEIASLRLIVVLEEVEDPCLALSCKTECMRLGAFLTHGEQALGRLKSELAAREAALDPADLATIRYAAQLAGEPRGVMLTHHSYMAGALAVQPLLPLQAQDVCLTCLDPDDGLNRLLHPLLMLAGGCLVFGASEQPVASQFKPGHVSMLVCGPHQLQELHIWLEQQVAGRGPIRRMLASIALQVAQHHEASQATGKQDWPLAILRGALDLLVLRSLRNRELGGLRLTFCEAPADPQSARFLRCVGLPLLEGYGIPEVASMLTGNLPAAFRPGTVGKPLPGVRLELAHDGEVLAAGPPLMLGYYKSADRTERTLVDGWLHTGAHGVLDADGFLTLLADDRGEAHPTWPPIAASERQS